MKTITQKLFLLGIIFITTTPVFAQIVWPSPEVGQMYEHAQTYVAAGNYKDAIITYRQAIVLAPDVLILYRDLGHTLYMAGNYKEAEQTLAPLIEKPGADTQCYQWLAAAQAAQKDTKHALTTLKKGSSRFPLSGMLYQETGNISMAEGKPEEAIKQWLDGIKQDPGYSKNYYSAAQVYMRSNKVLWGIIYAEQFLTMTQDTANDDEIKRALFAAYKKMFDNIAGNKTEQYGKEKKARSVNNFEDAVLTIYQSLTPVISDGITTENLTMIRVRFLMDWFSAYGNKYPYSLFSYQDKLIRSGHFDMYNEWLFGKAESAAEYKIWNEFHEGDMDRFLQWRLTNPYTAARNEFYNTRDMDGLFGKKRK